MPESKTAGSIQAAWALLAQGVSAARLDAVRLGHLMDRATALVDKSSEKEHLYEVAGDIIKAAPERLERINSTLDRLAYAVSLMGEQHLREQLPLSDRMDVDEALYRTPPLRVSAERVVLGYLAKQADLAPPLGYPGGPCHQVRRVHEEVRSPRVRDHLTDKIEDGEKLTPRDEKVIYDPLPEKGDGIFTSMVIVPHAQGRMDQRGVVVPEIRGALRTWSQTFMRGRELAKQNVRKPALRVLQSQYKVWQAAIHRREKIVWTDPTIKLTIVFVANGKQARIISAYWEGQPDPRPPGEGTCRM